MMQLDERLTRNQLRDIASRSFGTLVKGVIDVSRRILVIDMSLHADGEAYLLSQGSKQENVWGINLYPDLEGDDFVEFDSMINVRPSGGNNSRSVDDPGTQAAIRVVVQQYVA